ncbi:MAG: hypothetical protein JO362_23700 [Streptomycetaceae bacterium]|nr:hypothetical protein [Streptomycetaceae bacterium]
MKLPLQTLATFFPAPAAPRPGACACIAAHPLPVPSHAAGLRAASVIDWP